LQNVSLFLSCVPSISEVERLRLLGASLTDASKNTRNFSECCFDAVRWDLFPAHALEAGISGDLAYFETILGHAIPFTESTKRKLVKALVKRCQCLEEQLPHSYDHGIFLQSQERFFPKAPLPGLFSWLVDMNLPTQLWLSTAHTSNKHSTSHALCSLDRKDFGTALQSPVDEPWISWTSSHFCINPQGVGLMHGWRSMSDICKTFVVEASMNKGNWIELITCSGTPLSDIGQLFEIPESKSSGMYFDRFRIRMTGPTSTGSWHLMVGWFDVFGHAKAKSVLDGFEWYEDSMVHRV